MEQITARQANIGPTSAVTYLFGFTLVVFLASLIARLMMWIDPKPEGDKYVAERGVGGDDLAPGQESAL